MDIDPWGSDSVEDYSRLFDEFGIDEFDASDVPEPLELMRRGIIFGERDYDLVKDAMRNDEEFAALSGFMPSGNLHLGHLMVLRELVWHQQRGADTYFVIADLEAHSARDMSWEECERYAREYVLSLLALGFDPDEGEVYRQSDNDRLRDLAFELSEETNFNELNAIYGFDGETNIGHMQSTLTQAADILYPQLDEPKPTVIPVGADQDPHLRLTRGLARRMRMFGVTVAWVSVELDEDEKRWTNEAYWALQTADDTPHENRDVRAEDVAEWLEEEELVRRDDSAKTACDKLRSVGGEPLQERVRFVDRNATDEAFESLIDAIGGEKRVYEGHID
ncbi:MAG: tryptophan--tRNA ligase, partial [Halobacteriales archaeon]